MKTVRIAGVPEHFNFPWNLTIEQGEFDSEGINLIWENVPEGTGKLCQMLRDNSCDIAVILTEGIVKDIVQGSNAKIVQEYVKSPLLWGIHVAQKSNFKSIEQLKNAKIAISRFGSGSHLMSIVHAKQQDWNVDNLKFEIVNTIDGAVEALTNGTADYFMWERFMTKPIVDKGIFRHLGNCPTPWPSFVIAVTEEFLNSNKQTLKRILEIINSTTSEFKDIPSIDRTLSSNFNQKIDDIQSWLKATKWSNKVPSKMAIEMVQNELYSLNIIDKKITYNEIVETL